METTNWYRLPSKVNIKVPEELDPEEHHVQHAARSLLFDAVAKRSFANEHPQLMPQLFLHWKKEVMEKMDADKAARVHTAEKLEDLDEALQPVVLGLLDEITTQVHPNLLSLWQPEIDKQFKIFMKPQREALKDRRNNAEQKIKNLKKTYKA